MNIEELEEALGEILPTRFHLETNSSGQLVIFTGLQQDEDGELTDFESDEDEEDDEDEDLDADELEFGSLEEDDSEED
jgi:hypothetical protein